MELDQGIETESNNAATAGTDFDTSTSRDLDRSRDRGDRERDTERDRRQRPTVRDTIRQSFDDVRQDEQLEERYSRARDRGTERQPATETETERQTSLPERKAETQAPTSWTKDAKEAWTDLPDRIKQEVTKREQDMQKGVDALKTQYKDIDEAIAPYLTVIRQFQKTPSQAVAQLFAWFDALAKNPDQAFPALLQSYRYDPARLLAFYGVDPRDLQQFIQYKNAYLAQQQQQAQANGQVQQQEEISPVVRNYIGTLENKIAELSNAVGQQFNALGQTFAEQNAAKTQEMLDRWSSDKPYFDQVRVMMGHLLTPDPTTGQAAVPLRDGKVDLDEAYIRSCWMVPEIREQMLTNQQVEKEAARKAREEAAFKAQQDKSNQARRTATSVRTSSPGAQVGRQVVPQRGLSVRESLKQAIADLSN